MSRLVSTYGSYDKPIPKIYGGEKKQLQTDVVVIGAGGCGLAAAVRCVQNNFSVIVIDKMEVPGGNTRLAGGLLCTNSEILKKKGIPDTTDAHLKTYLKHHLYQVDRNLVEKYIRNTGRCYDWLVSMGLDVNNHRIVMDNVVMTKERKDMGPLRNPAYGPGLMGSEVIDTLLGELEKNEALLLLETQVTEILTQDNHVTGVKAVGQGKDYEIKADHVILASGGFGRNTGMLKKYFPKFFTSDNLFTHYCFSHNTGDGITMAEQIGAKVGDLMSFGLESMVHLPGTHSLGRVSLEPCGIVVNENGERFISEDDMENGEFLMDQQPNGVAWFLFPENKKDLFYQLALDHRRYGDWMPDFDEFHDDLEREQIAGTAVYGDSVASLAEKIHADPAVLEKTLKRYQTFCEEERDADFFKEKECLIPLGVEGGWYGLRLLRKFDVTMGGVSINEKLQVIKEDKSIIGGLYAGGDIASGWMGEEYGPLFSSFAWSVNSGYLAAEEISKQER